MADIDIQKARECLLDFRERFIAFAQLALAKDLFDKEWVVFEPVSGAGVLIDDALKALGLVIGEPPATPEPVPDAPAGDDLDSMAWITSLANGRQHDAVD